MWESSSIPLRSWWEQKGGEGWIHSLCLSWDILLPLPLDIGTAGSRASGLRTGLTPSSTRVSGLWVWTGTLRLICLGLQLVVRWSCNSSASIITWAISHNRSLCIISMHFLLVPFLWSTLTNITPLLKYYPLIEAFPDPLRTALLPCSLFFYGTCHPLTYCIISLSAMSINYSLSPLLRMVDCFVHWCILVPRTCMAWWVLGKYLLNTWKSAKA